jgi:3-oxoacyl-[acyl-carrier protein] reductase
MNSMLETAGAVAVITGAGSGIGAGLARKWASAGGKSVLADIDSAGLREVADDIQKNGGDVRPVTCDVTVEKENRDLARLAVEVFGHINLVAPCAGIIDDGVLLSIDKNTGQVNDSMSLEQFRSVLDVNLTGTFLTVRECSTQMINTGSGGLICLLSSISSLGTAGQINYSSSKAAVSAMPKVITSEFFRKGIAGQIRCVAVAPGYVDTPMVNGMNAEALERIREQIPIGRMISVEEVVSLVMELYRNEACAGETYYVHGGLRLGSKG